MTGSFDGVIINTAANRAFHAFIEQKRHSVNGADELTGVDFQFSRVVSRNSGFIVHEFILDQSGDDRIVVDLKDDVAAANVDLYIFCIIGGELFDFGQRFTGNDKAFLSVIGDIFLADSQTVTVYGNNLDGVVLDFKQRTFMGRFDVLIGYRINRLLYHAFQGLAAYYNRIGSADRRQFRKFCSEHDRSIREGWREEITPKNPYESLKNNWALEAVLDRIYEKRKKGEEDISVLPFFSLLHFCVKEGGEFLVPIDFKPGFPVNLGGDRPAGADASDEDADFVLKHIVDNEDKVSLAVYTSESEFEKGGPASIMPLPMEECMQIALETDYLTGMVINPYGNAFIMDKETLKGFLDMIHS